MDRIFWIVEALIVSTLLLAVAVAYIHGIEEGINSQLSYIHMLEQQLHPELERLYVFGYSHPLGNVLLGIGFSLTLCWISVAAMFLGRRKSKSKT